jgi:hypothetical protein
MNRVNGILTGLVDWEYIEEWPLGWELRAVFWTMGKGMGEDEDYVLRDNSPQIEDAFWKEFGARLPTEVSNSVCDADWRHRQHLHIW